MGVKLTFLIWKDRGILRSLGVWGTSMIEGI